MRFKIALFILVVSFPVIAQQGNEKLQTLRMSIINIDNEKIPVNLELACSESEHTYGLMYRDKLDENSGMLFVFPDDGYRNFWMKNTRIPLSIAYIDAKGKILEIYDMKPLDTSITYPSKFACRYALEVNKGWFKKHNIRTGSVLFIEGIK
ncbi:MAG TPA: DUF192 domain-containing protein [Spirochaetota bacterium]